MGPRCVPLALKTAVPAGGLGGAGDIATRAPQRAQKTSTPGATGLPHDPQSAVEAGGPGSASCTRPPQRGQKGSEGSSGAEQNRHGCWRAEVPTSLLRGAPFCEMRVGGTAKAASPEPGTGMTRAPETTGLPQSMQNFEAGSLSRPQKVQRITGGAWVLGGWSPANMAGPASPWEAHGPFGDFGAVPGVTAERRPLPDPPSRASLPIMLRPVVPTLLALLLVTARVALAQVRPDLDWRTLHAEHVRVHFTPELEELARRTAANAERAYRLLSADLAPPRGMIDIVLADNVDYANGYATPYPTNRIVVYARPPVEDLALRNHADWNALLVTHEMAHIFHTDRVRGFWDGLQQLFGRAAPLFPNTYAPSWLLEGLAVHYETRLTGGGRLAGTEFPSLARAAALDGALPPLDALSQARPHFPGAAQSYLYGAFLFDGREGAAVGRFVEYASEGILPWRHDAHARDAFGETFTARWAAWRDSVARASAGLPPDAPGTRSLTVHGWTARFPRFIAEDELVYVANDAVQVTGLYRLGLDGTRRRVGRRNSVDASAPDRRGGTVQGEWDLTDPYSVHGDLYEGRGRGRRRITDGQRLSAPDIHPATRRIVAVQTIPGSTSLVVRHPGNDYLREVAPGTLDRTWSEPRWSANGEWIAASRWERGGRTAVVVMDTAGTIVQTFAPRGRPLSITSSPAWVAGDTALVFVSDHEGRPMVYLGDVRTGAYARAWSSPTALNTPDVSPSGRRLAAVELRGDGYHVVTREMPPDLPLSLPAADGVPDAPVPTAARDATADIREYSAWREMRPRWWLPVAQETDNATWRVGAMTGHSDVLGRHRYAAEVSRDLEHPEWTMAGAYTYARYGNPVGTLSVEQSWLHAAITSNGDRIGVLAQRTRNASLQVLYSRPRVRLSSFALAGLEVDWVDYKAYPLDTLRYFLGPEAYVTTTSFPTARLSLGVSTMQRPGLSVSVEDGVAADVTMRLRFDSGIQYQTVQETITEVSAAKSIPFPGFARHVLAARAAYGRTLHEATTAFSVGGNSGSSLDVLPGIAFGDSRRSFFVRGFDAGAQLGVRAAAGSVEYRAPLGLVGRGIRLLPVFLQKTSLVAFADAGAGWCERQVAFSFICPDSVPHRRWMMSAGGELVLDAALQYDILYRFRVGVAAPVRNREFASRRASLYLSLGAAF